MPASYVFSLLPRILPLQFAHPIYHHPGYFCRWMQIAPFWSSPIWGVAHVDWQDSARTSCGTVVEFLVGAWRLHVGHRTTGKDKQERKMLVFVGWITAIQCQYEIPNSIDDKSTLPPTKFVSHFMLVSFPNSVTKFTWPNVRQTNNKNKTKHTISSN